MSYSFLNNINLKQNNQIIWYAEKNNYRNFLINTIKIKKFIQRNLKNTKGYYITDSQIKVQIKKDTKDAKNSSSMLVVVYYYKTMRKLKMEQVSQDIQQLFKALKPQLDLPLIVETINQQRPLTSALYIVQEISNYMKSRINIKRLFILANKVISDGRNGCMIILKGRINGHTITRKDKVAVGYVKRNTLKNNVEFQRYTHVGKSGCVGIKVWINKGKV